MKMTIYGEFPGMNEFIKANRSQRGRWNAGNDMKQRCQHAIAVQLPRWSTTKPVWIRYVYFCPNRKKDLDNISGFFHKVFQDALVQKKVIPNDNWTYIKGFSDEFFLDREHPRIEVEVIEL